jgi:hypothetical protein
MRNPEDMYPRPKVGLGRCLMTSEEIAAEMKGKLESFNRDLANLELRHLQYLRDQAKATVEATLNGSRFDSKFIPRAELLLNSLVADLNVNGSGQEPALAKYEAEVDSLVNTLRAELVSGLQKQAEDIISLRKKEVFHARQVLAQRRFKQQSATQAAAGAQATASTLDASSIQELAKEALSSHLASRSMTNLITKAVKEVANKTATPSSGKLPSAPGKPPRSLKSSQKTAPSRPQQPQGNGKGNALPAQRAKPAKQSGKGKKGGSGNPPSKRHSQGQGGQAKTQAKGRNLNHRA